MTCLGLGMGLGLGLGLRWRLPCELPRQSSTQHRQNGGFLRFEAIAQLALDRGLDLQDQVAIEIRREHLGMYVAFPTDRRSIAKAPGDVLDGGSKIALGLGGSIEAFHFI